MASSAVSATGCPHGFRHAAASFRGSGRARRGYYRHHGRFIGSMAWNLLLTHPLSRLIIVKLCKETTANSSRAAQQSPRLVLECEWFLEIQDCNIGAGHNALAERGRARMEEQDLPAPATARISANWSATVLVMYRSPRKRGRSGTAAQ
jgi:hypothetical protein